MTTTTACPAWCTTDHDAERTAGPRRPRPGAVAPAPRRPSGGAEPGRHQGGRGAPRPRTIQVLVINAPDPLGCEVQLTVAQARRVSVLLARASDLINPGG